MRQLVVASLLLASASAWAEDPAPAEALAEAPAEAPTPPSPPAKPLPPGGDAPPPPPNRAGAPPKAIPATGGPPARPARDPERMALVRQYRAQRLVLRGETEIQPGNAYAFTSGYGPYPYGAVGLSHTTVIHEPATTTRTWGIYQGPQRLAVPTFLSAAGEADRSAVLSGQITKSRKATRTWFTVAGVGGAAIMTGMVGMGAAEELSTAQAYNTVALGGVGFLVTGLVAASFPSAKAHKLARYPSATLTVDEAQGLVDRHNDALREELGLSADEVWSIEVGNNRR